MTPNLRTLITTALIIIIGLILVFASKCGAQTRVAISDSVVIDTLNMPSMSIADFEKKLDSAFRFCRHENLKIDSWRDELWICCIDCMKPIRKANDADVQALCRHNRGSYYTIDSSVCCRMCHRHKTFYGWTNKEEFERRERLEMQQWRRKP